MDEILSNDCQDEPLKNDEFLTKDCIEHNSDDLKETKNTQIETPSILKKQDTDSRNVLEDKKRPKSVNFSTDVEILDEPTNDSTEQLFETEIDYSEIDSNSDENKGEQSKTGTKIIDEPTNQFTNESFGNETNSGEKILISEVNEKQQPITVNFSNDNEKKDKKTSEFTKQSYKSDKNLSEKDYNSVIMKGKYSSVEELTEKDLMLQKYHLKKVNRKKVIISSYFAVLFIILLAGSLAMFYDLPVRLEENKDDSVLFISGGFKDGVLTDETEIFAKSQFCRGPLLPVKKARHAVGMLNYLGKQLLMVCGGVETDDQHSVSSCYTYDGDNWIDGASLIIPTASSAYTTLDNKLFVIGGRNNDKFVKDVQIYDPRKGIWTLDKKSLFYGLMFACAVNFENYIIIAGGEQDRDDWKERENQVWLKSINDDNLSWVRLPRMIFSSFNPGCTLSSVSGQTIMLVVGGSKSYYRAQMMIWNNLNPLESTWKELNQLNRLHQFRPPVIYLSKEKVFRVLYGSKNAFSESISSVEEMSIEVDDENIEYSKWSLSNVYNITHNKYFVSYTEIPSKLLKCNQNP